MISFKARYWYHYQFVAVFKHGTYNAKCLVDSSQMVNCQFGLCQQLLACLTYVPNHLSLFMQNMALSLLSVTLYALYDPRVLLSKVF